MSNVNSPTAHQNKLDRFRMARMVVAGVIILAVMLFMVSQVINANASARPIGALQSSVVPRPRPRPTLPKTGGEVETPAQNNSDLAMAGIVGLGVVLVAGGAVVYRMSIKRKSDSA